MVTLGPKHGTGNIGPVTLTGCLSFMPAKVNCLVVCRAFVTLITSYVHSHINKLPLRSAVASQTLGAYQPATECTQKAAISRLIVMCPVDQRPRLVQREDNEGSWHRCTGIESQHGFLSETTSAACDARLALRECAQRVVVHDEEAGCAPVQLSSSKNGLLHNVG